MADRVSDLSLSDLVTGGRPKAPPKIKLSAIRAQYPMYADLSDDDLLIGLRRKHYADIPLQQFLGRIEYDTQRADPTADMGSGERLLAGVGKGMTDLARGAGQRLGLTSQADIDDAKALDAPLMNTSEGTVGNVAGKVAVALPTMLIPGANTLTGAALVGAGQGALEPTATGESVLGNAAAGAAGGAGGVLLGRVARAGYQGAKGLLEPFTAAGRDRITGRVLNEFAQDPAAAAAAAAAAPARTVTGSAPMLDEATRDVGLAQLRRAMVSADTQVASDVAAREMANNAARVEALRSVAGGATQPLSRVRRLNQIAGGQPTRAAAEATRGAAAGRSYGEAFEAGVDPQMAEAMAPQIAAIMERPSVRSGLARARAMAAEEGIDLADSGSVRGLHYLKQALDDQVGRLRDTPARQRLVQQTSSDLASVLEEIAPLYQQARREFQFNSVPVNRADVGQRLMDSASSAARDLGGNRRLQANAFARALNDEGELIRRSTGFRGGPQNLEDFMSPTQMGRINAVRDELETVANLSTAGKVTGSPTAQYLAAQNALKRLAGPTGMPQSWVEGLLNGAVGDAMSNTLGAGYRFTGAAPRLQTRIAQALLDPQSAAPVMQQALPTQQVPRSALAQALLKTLETSAKRTPSAIFVED